MTEEIFMADSMALIERIVTVRNQIKRDQDTLEIFKEELYQRMVTENFDCLVNDNYEIMIIGQTLNTGSNACQLEIFERLGSERLKTSPEKECWVKVEELPV